LIIPIDEQYRIATDPYQWMVQKKRTRRNKEDWQSQTYHSTFESAVRELGERMVRESKANTLVDALADLEKITTTLSQALTPHSELILEAMAKEQK
tara:strand:+ start:120 stop:407 length:288 start_codon:yes stop_codon:yes gene_type:complete